MTRENFDALGQASGGELVAISPVCHTGLPVFVAYSINEGCLVLICAACRKLVAKVQVATTTGPCSEEVH